MAKPSAASMDVDANLTFLKRISNLNEIVLEIPLATL
jgi:hypothetical protein